VVLAGDGRAVIVDFDSCWPVGESLKGKKVGSCSDESLFSNNLEDVKQLEAWLAEKMKGER
jgi:hypothetical protein